MRVEAASVRRSVVALFAVLFACTLLAAAPGPSILGTPVLVVYPFSANGSDITKEAGSRLAVTIATQIANLGGVEVKPASPGVERQNYLDAAHSQGADYYIAGYLTPLGDGVSLVEQLVSTQTGIVVFSNTAQVRTFEDIAGQGDVLHDALLRHQTRNLGAYAAPPPPANSATPTPAPGSATQANLGRLFGRKQKRATTSPTPAAQPSPGSAVARATPPAASPNPAPRPTSAPAVARATATPATPAPSASSSVVAAVPEVKRGSGYGLLAIGGPAEVEQRAFTGAAIRNDMLAKRRRVGDAGATREAACSANSIDTLLGGNLSTHNHTILGQAQTIAILELLAYDCAGNIVYRKTFAHDARGDWKNAVDGVVASAISAFLREPRGSHPS